MGQGVVWYSLLGLMALTVLGFIFIPEHPMEGQHHRAQPLTRSERVKVAVLIVAVTVLVSFVFWVIMG